MTREYFIDLEKIKSKYSKNRVCSNYIMNAQAKRQTFGMIENSYVRLVRRR